MQERQIILGIDPGTKVTGYGIIVVENGHCKVLDYGCIKPPASLKLTDRYLILFNGVNQLIEMHHPDVLSVETQYVYKNIQSAIKLGMARGVVLIAAKKSGVSVVEYAPTQAKKAVVGNGRASKKQVQGMIQRLLGLQMPPEPEDAADALALAMCHAHSLRSRKLFGTEI